MRLAVIVLLILAGAVAATLVPGASQALFVSRQQPWGIVTCAFSHISAEHLAVDAVVLVLLTVLIYGLCLMYSPCVVPRLKSACAVAIVAAWLGSGAVTYVAIVSGVMGPSELVVSGGLSGIVYGLMACACCMGVLSVRPLVYSVRRSKDAGLWCVSAPMVMGSAVAVAMALLILALVLTSPVAVFGIGSSEVNWYGHVAGFSLAAVAFAAYTRSFGGELQRSTFVGELEDLVAQTA